ncbi:MAG TPA: cytochrome b/b6 domain-containing protein [Hyphomonadaceae bacterium]|nr:cytochrome b/b6 domain-containing protein [Hyphomonadaceae bacterium]
MDADTGAQPSFATTQKVWDAPTRLFHWLVVGLIAFSWWTAEEHIFDWHKASGLAIVGLLVFRIYWGVAGPETARFAHFIKGPRTILSYVGSLFGPEHKLAFGHNPLGGLSVAAMIVALVAQVTLGLFAPDTDTGLDSGPLSRFVSYDFAEMAGDLHEDAFNILLFLIGIHIAAIAFYLIVKRANLIGPMITGRRKSGATGPARGLASVALWRFVLGVLIAGAVVWPLATM